MEVSDNKDTINHGPHFHIPRTDRAGREYLHKLNRNASASRAFFIYIVSVLFCTRPKHKDCKDEKDDWYWNFESLQCHLFDGKLIFLITKLSI